jgi:hypothetical protein
MTSFTSFTSLALTHSDKPISPRVLTHGTRTARCTALLRGGGLGLADEGILRPSKPSIRDAVATWFVVHLRARLSLALVFCVLCVPQLTQAAVIGAQIITGTVNAPTGTAGFNVLPVDIMPVPDACTSNNNVTYTPGNDACGTDLIVRTNDTVVFQMTYATNGADTVTITSTLPNAPSGVSAGLPVADWQPLPPQCIAGSSITANGQTMVCVISISASGTQSILPVAKVRGDIANGAVFNIPATSVTALGGGSFNANNDVLSTAGPLKVSAAPLYDLDKARSTGGFQFVKGRDGVTDGWLITYPLIVRVPYGAKGLEMLNATGMTMTDAISSIVVVGNPTIQAAIRASAVLYNTGGWVSPVTTVACGGNINPALYNRSGGQNRVLGSNGVGSQSLDLTSNGSCTATQPGNSPGGDISIALTAVNWSNPFPATRNDGGPTALLPYDSEVVSNRLAIWVPTSVFSTVSSGSLSIQNTYTNVSGTSISGQPLQQPTVPDGSSGGTVNDSGTVGTPPFGPAGSMSKNYTNCSDIGCAFINNSGNHTRDGTTVPGQYYSGNLAFANVGASYLSGVAMCDKLDNTKNILQEIVVGDDSIMSVVYYSVKNLVRNTDYIIEFGTGGLNGAGASWANNADFATATCADDQSPAWYASLSLVPGGAPMVTKVRVRLINPLPPTMNFMAFLRLRNTSPSLIAGFGSPVGTVWPVNTKINNWITATADYLTGAPTGNLNGVAKTWLVGAAGDYVANGAGSTSYTDTINQAFAQVRISKEIQGQTNSTTPSAVIAGSVITYILKPTLTAAVAGLPAVDVQITDILPPATVYVAGSASLAPTSIQSNTPSAGYTTLVWDIPSIVPNVAITPITFQVQTDATASNNLNIPNFTKITSPADPTPDCSTPASGLYGTYTTTGTATAGALCVRAARRDLMLSNPLGFKVFKQVNKALIDRDQSIVYTVNWLSIGGAPATIDIIDVLPYVGDGAADAGINFDGRIPPSSYVGTSRLAAALNNATAVAGDAAATFWYTNKAGALIDRDPQVASNGAMGLPSGIWCNAVGGIGANCPATLADVTAVRMVSGTTLVDGTARTFSYMVNTNANATGNVYTNDFNARGTGLANLVTSNDVTTSVVAGVLSGNVYYDVNNDGMKGVGETGLNNVQICLSGYSFGPDGVDNAGAGDDVAVPLSNCVLTAGGGIYTFSNVPAGKYTLTQIRNVVNSPGLVGYIDGKDTIGTGGGTVNNGNGVTDDAFSLIVLTTGSTLTGYNFGEQLPKYTVSGTVFNDVNGLTDTFVNGIGTEAVANGLLSAYLVDSTNKVVATSDVAANGTYSFPNILAATGFTVVLANRAPLVTDIGVAPPSASVPTGWANTGEVNGTTVTPNSEIASAIGDGVSASFNVVSADVVNINFGIEQPPTATAANPAIQANPGGTVLVTVSPASFGAADATGITSYAFTGAFPANAASIKIGAITYYAANWNTLPTSFVALPSVDVDPIPGAVTIQLPYTVADAAGKTASATVNVQFTAGTVVSGTVYNDTNGNTDTFVNGTVVNGTTAPFTATLTAYLVNGAGIIVGNSPVSATGTYSFSDVPAGPGYYVALSNVATTTGFATGINYALPASGGFNWVNTSEVIGVSGVAINAEVGAAIGDGKSPAFTLVAGTDQANVNFGIEQAPTATAGTPASQANPGGTNSVTVPASNFGSADATAVTSYAFSGAFPAGATSVTLAGIKYTSADWATRPATFVGSTPPTVSVDPGPGAVTVPLQYTVADAAGKTTVATVNVQFTAGQVLSGTVYDDVNGLNDAGGGVVGGVGIIGVVGQAGVFATLTAYLVDTTAGTIFDKVLIAVNGTYNFADVPNGNYQVILSNVAAAANVATITTTLPLSAGAGSVSWVNTGENIGAGVGSDGTPNGKTDTAITLTGAGLINVNFGIEVPPTTAPVNPAPQANPGGAVFVTIAPASFAASDPTGITSYAFTGGFPAGATSVKLAGVTYNAGNWGTRPAVFLGAAPPAVEIDPVAGATTVALPYTVADAAGLPASGNVNVQFTSGPSLSGNVYNDVNGNNDVGGGVVNGPGVVGGTAPFATLTAYLVNTTTNTIVASVAVGAGGSYIFGDVANANYQVMVSTTAGAASVAAIVTTAPAGYVHTGSQVGTTAGGAAVGAPGVSPAIVFTGANVTNVNFGIEQPPTAVAMNLTNQTNPGGTVNVTVPLLNLGMSDPAPGGVTGVSFTGTFPGGLTSITINGLTYVAAGAVGAQVNWPLGGVVLSVPLTSLTIDPVDGATMVNLPYTVTDAAGKSASASLSVGFASSEIATVPTLSEMALLLLMLMMMSSGWLVLRRR